MTWQTNAGEHPDRGGRHARGVQAEPGEGPLARGAGDLDERKGNERVEGLALHGAAEPLDEDLGPGVAPRELAQSVRDGAGAVHPGVAIPRRWLGVGRPVGRVGLGTRS